MKERPETPDLDWFIRDLMRIAVRAYGYYVSESALLVYEDLRKSHLEETVKWWKEHHLSGFVDVEQLERDWRAFLRGKKDLSGFTAQYCFDSLLQGSSLDLPYDVPETDKTERNAQALSRALKEVLPQELQRYRQEKSEALKPNDWVSQKVAAEFLQCGDRWVRQLADTNRLVRHTTSGKISTDSIRSYLKSKDSKD